MKFVIIGAGDVGTSLSINLSNHKHEVALIERDSEHITKEIESHPIQVIIGNGTSPDILMSAGVDNTDYVISVTDSDEANIAASFVSRLINPQPKRIARLRDIELSSKHIPSELISEYLDLIIDPEQAAADNFIQLLRIPGAREIVEFENGKVRIIGLSVEPKSPLLDIKLSQLKEWQNELPLLIVAVMRGSKIIVPRGDDKIKPGDVIYAATIPEKTKLLFELAGKELHQGQNAIIWGDSPLSRTLAVALEEQGTSVKLILSDAEAAAKYTDVLKSTLILVGEGTDQNLLIQEGVADTDAFIVVTPDDENNILAALLAKKLGAKTTMALINKSSYMPLVSAIGVDVVISSRLAAASAIFRHIHSHSIIYESALQHEGAGFIEIDAAEDLPLRGIPIKELKLPYGILVTAIIRGEKTIIPTGDDSILQGDRVVIFVVKSALKKLEKLLDLKLELFA